MIMNRGNGQFGADRLAHSSYQSATHNMHSGCSKMWKMHALSPPTRLPYDRNTGNATYSVKDAQIAHVDACMRVWSCYILHWPIRYFFLFHRLMGSAMETLLYTDTALLSGNNSLTLTAEKRSVHCHGDVFRL